MTNIPSTSPRNAAARGLDCVVVGYNDVPLEVFARKHRPFQKHSGTYSELKTNSVLVGGERKNYMDLLNYVLEKDRGASPNLNAFELPNLGAVYLTSFLRRRNFSVELVNFYNFDKERLADLLAEGPRAVVITTTYYVDEEPIKEVVSFIRERRPETCIVVGGPYVHNVCTANDAATQALIFRTLGADVYITDSQGEATLAKVLDCLRGGHRAGLAFIPNLIYRDKDASLGRTHRAEERNSLDEDAVDWSSFDPGLYAPTAYMRTARSCPFACAFCNYPAMSGEHTLASVETVRRELRYLVDRGLEQMIFVDDTFNVPLPRFKQLCRMMIEERFDLRWVSFFRCSNADDECFDLMKESGCLGVYLGIESGDQRILNNMNKFADVRRYKEAIAKLHERDILTFGSFIAGHPGETQESVMNTIEFIEEIAPTFYNVQLYFHDPLAPINRRRDEFGIKGSHYNWRHDSMDWREGTDWVEYIIRRVENSTLLTLYGFSIWSIPYLLQKGLSVGQIKEFARAARGILVKGLDDSEGDYRDEFSRMREIFSGLPLEGERVTR